MGKLEKKDSLKLLSYFGFITKIYYFEKCLFKRMFLLKLDWNFLRYHHICRISFLYTQNGSIVFYTNFVMLDSYKSNWWVISDTHYVSAKKVSSASQENIKSW